FLASARLLSAGRYLIHWRDRLRSGVFGLLPALCEIVKRRRDTAFRVGNTREGKAHLDTAQRAGQHEVVEITQMTDAENSSLQLRQTRSERHVELVEDHLAQLVCIMSRRHQNRCQGAAVLF